MRIKLDKERGFSLLEIIMVLAIFSIISVGIFNSFTTGMKVYKDALDLTRGDTQATAVTDYLGQYLIDAGNFGVIPDAGTNSVTFQKPVEYSNASNSVVWSNDYTLQFVLDDGEEDNDADDNNDNRPDEGSIKIVLPDSSTRTIASDVKDFTITRNGDVLHIAVTVFIYNRDGVLLEYTSETDIHLLNVAIGAE